MTNNITDINRAKARNELVHSTIEFEQHINLLNTFRLSPYYTGSDVAGFTSLIPTQFVPIIPKVYNHISKLIQTLFAESRCATPNLSFAYSHGTNPDRLTISLSFYPSPRPEVNEEYASDLIMLMELDIIESGYNLELGGITPALGTDILSNIEVPKQFYDWHASGIRKMVTGWLQFYGDGKASIDNYNVMTPVNMENISMGDFHILSNKHKLKFGTLDYTVHLSAGFTGMFISK